MDITDKDCRGVVGAQAPNSVTAIAYTAPINDASAFSGLSRSEIYRCLAAGKIRAVKSGKRTLIVMDSLRTHLANLPPAKFTPSEVREAA